MKKTMITLAGVALLAATAVHGATKEEVTTLANTPNSQVTAANAMDVYKAALEVNSIGRVWWFAREKIINHAEMYKAALEADNLFAARVVADIASNTVWHAEILAKHADNVIAGKYSEEEYKKVANEIGVCLYDNAKFLLSVDTDATIAIGEKLVKAEKWITAMEVLYKYYWEKDLYAIRLSKVDDKYLSLFLSKIAAGNVGAYWRKHVYFDVLTQGMRVKKFDEVNAIPADVVEKVCADVDNEHARCWAFNYDAAEPFLGKLRAFEVKSPNITDALRVKIAKFIDGIAKNKAMTESVYGMFTDKNSKLAVALYLADKDKVIDAFAALDNTADAKLIDQALMAINALDIDYRAADVKKALRNVNAKYTLKLYEDRDSWEPVLSKVRAMIEVR